MAGGSMSNKLILGVPTPDGRGHLTVSLAVPEKLVPTIADTLKLQPPCPTAADLRWLAEVLTILATAYDRLETKADASTEDT
jgi:hypothetical protein